MPKKEGDKITLSDDGYILSDLCVLHENSPMSNLRQRMAVIRAIRSYDVEVKDGEMILVTDAEHYPDDLHTFYRAMMHASDVLTVFEEK